MKKNNEQEGKLSKRFLARIIIEAKTPLSVKSGEKSVITDAVVITDVNGLPYIPGSSIAGVMRHAWKELKGKDHEESLFGYPGEKEGEGAGSRVIFSEARILNSRGEVMDGMLSPEEISNDSLLKYFVALPIRQHVRINHQGVSEVSGKFDEQVVFAGTRFCFEIEMLGNDNEGDTFSALLDILYLNSFRLGSGTRSGFGEIRVIGIQQASMSMDDERYLEKSSNLKDSGTWKCWTELKTTDEVPEENRNSGNGKTPEDGWAIYTMKLKLDSFFLFGSGFGDEDADMTPVTEMRVSWKHIPAQIEEHVYLLPASSIKGAIAHRVAFYYNRFAHVFADEFVVNAKNKVGNPMDKYVGSNNVAVRLLFGSEGKDGTEKMRGNVIFSDLLYASGLKEKVLNHVSIDRFTGGSINGALFSEKVVYGKNATFTLTLSVNESAIARLAGGLHVSADNVIGALETAMKDICRGLLPLGGGVNRGNGRFEGIEIKKNNETVWKA